MYERAVNFDSIYLGKEDRQKAALTQKILMLLLKEEHENGRVKKAEKKGQNYGRLLQHAPVIRIRQ